MDTEKAIPIVEEKKGPKFPIEYEIRAIIDNMYMLGGCRGTMERDQQYKDNCVNRILELMKS